MFSYNCHKNLFSLTDFYSNHGHYNLVIILIFQSTLGTMIALRLVLFKIISKNRHLPTKKQICSFARSMQVPNNKFVPTDVLYNAALAAPLGSRSPL